MGIDPTTVTTADPAPALWTLGYEPHAQTYSMWVHASRPEISVWLARGGDYMWRDHAAGRSGNLIHLIRDIYPSLSFYAAFARAQDLLSAPIPNHPSTASSLFLKESAASAATDFPKKDSLAADDVELSYLSGAQIWTPGSPIPAPLADRYITHIAQKFGDTFSVTGEDSVRVPGYGLYDDGRIGMLGYDTHRSNGRFYSLKGGRAGITMTAGLDHATRIVITSSLIDAMAHDLIHAEDWRRGYIAVRTGAEGIAVRLIRGLVDLGAPVEEVTISTANDGPGLLIASKIKAGLTAGPGPVTEIPAHYVPPIGAERTNGDALSRIMTATSRLAGQIREQIATRTPPVGRHPAEFITDIAAE